MRRLLVVLCLLGTVAGGLSTVPATPASAAPAFTARGSVNQVYGTGFTVGAAVELLDAGGTTLQSGTADAQGALLFRKVAAGTGYQVRSQGETATALTVTDPDQHPAQSWYAQQATADPLVAGGFDYLTTRDGTKLSVNITMPTDGSTGPWPVIVNYSGYDPSQPGNAPAETGVLPFQGYVVVGVNLRGTTCSGGAFEFMEDLVGTDGYDVVETVARQSWSNGDVGLYGISYGGYSQLYVGATNPPHLRAMAPLSPFSDTYSAILYPGGILNNGFAVDWATEREADARPRAHGWVRSRISGGDTVCDANQALRLQSKPLLERIFDTPYADHAFDYLNTETFVHKIKAPTFLSSSWQDEQTGGSAINLAPLFDPATKLYVNGTNGTHVEPMAPTELTEVLTFLDLYVGKRVPKISPVLTAAAGTALAGIFGETDVNTFNLPQTPLSTKPNRAAALAAFEGQPRVRIRWENGSVPGREGLPFAAATSRYTAWPVPGTTNEKLYLQPDGALGAAAPALDATAARATSSYTYDPTTKRTNTFDGGTDAMWAAHPDVHWDVLREGNSLNFLTPAYPKRTAYAGQGSVDLWLQSTAADTDLETTLTEVRPDGKEVLVQSGWLRASHRTLDPARSTELVPYHDHQEVDASPLPAGQLTPVRVELFPFAHVVRPGSRLRLNIEAPGGNQPFWAFQTLPGTATNTIGHSTAAPSRVVLPRLPDAAVPNVPTALPACSKAGVTTQSVSLRNQPCRAYVPARIPTAVTAAAAGTGLKVTWKAPAGTAATSYRVTPALAPGAPDGSTAPAPVTVAGTTTAATFADLPDDVPLTFTVTATYGATATPTSNASVPVQQLPPTLVAFGSWEAFVRRQLTDLTGAAPAASVVLGTAALNGGQAPEAYVASLRRGPDALANVDPVTRLYLAYFRRVPDASGHAYWLRKRRAGTTLLRISAVFAASSEFRTTYGALSNRQFVELVYQNVTGRAGDPAGITFWTGRLDRGAQSRALVMIGFSESSEFRARAAAQVDVANVWIALLGRAPTTTEQTELIARLEGGTELSVLVAEVLASSAYAARIP